MKKNCNRLVSLLLTIIMVLGVCPVTVFAEEATPNPYGYENYVAMGTSITGGYGMGSHGGSSTAGAFGSGVYPRLIADYFGIPEKGRYDGALLGTRTKEFRVLLEDEFHGDDFTEGWSEEKCGNGEKKLKKISGEYKEALSAADLITFEMGSNDLLSYIMYYMQVHLEELAEDPSYADIVNSWGIIGKKSVSEMPAETASITTQLRLYVDILTSILKLKNQAMIEFRENFDAVISDIRAINPTADMYLISIYNPTPFLLTHTITNNANGSETLKEILLTVGKMLNMTEAQTVAAATLLTNLACAEMNLYMSTLSTYSAQYTYVDLSGIDLLGSDDGTHPSNAGHAYIAEHIETAILKKFDCPHVHMVTRNAKAPTLITLGYTGDVVCADCGSLFELGTLITYPQYLRQLAAGEIPEIISEDEDPVFLPPDKQNYPEEGTYDLLAFTSDIHNQAGNISADRFENCLSALQNGIKPIDFLGLCGDMGRGKENMSAADYWNLVAPVFDVLDNSGITYKTATTGNHEQHQGDYNNNKDNTVAQRYVQMFGKATVRDNANYQVYCFGAAGPTYVFDDEEINNLDEYLSKVDKNTPVFVLSHYPLHDTGGRAIGGEEEVIKVLNKYPNVIFIWGHNHTNADDEEQHYDRVFTEKIDEIPINFTYASAGCMSDAEYGNGSAAVKGKALVVTVSNTTPDVFPAITMRYVDANGYTVVKPVTVDNIGNGAHPFEENNFNPIATPSSFPKASVTDIQKATDTNLYVIAYNDIALDTSYCSGYMDKPTSTSTSSSSHTGFKGKQVEVVGDAVISGVYEDMIWALEPVGGEAFRIRNVVTGTYLNAANTSSTNKLLCDETVDTWTLKDGKLKSANAGKYLAFDTDEEIQGKVGVYNFFTIRSNSGEGDALTFYKVSESPVKEAAVTEKAVEPMMAAKTLVNGNKYVIVSKDHALGTSPHDGFTKKKFNGGNIYSGLGGIEIAVKGDKLDSFVSSDMIWECIAGENGYQFRNAETGTYLSSTYKSKTGRIMLTADSGDEWTFSAKGELMSTASEKYLTYDDTKASQIESGSSGLFDVHSDGSKIQFFDVTDSTVLAEHNAAHNNTPATMTDLEKVEKPENGHFVIVYGNRAMAAVTNEGYTNDSGYRYEGLDDKKVTFNGSRIEKDSLTTDIVWELKKVDGGYTIQNAFTNGYLNASGKFSSSTNGGLLKADDTQDTWSLKNGILTSTNAGKSLAYETAGTVSGEYEGNLNFFNIRSDGTPVSFYYIENIEDIKVPNTFDFEGQCTIWERSTVAKGTFAILINGNAIGVKDGKLIAMRSVDESMVNTLDDAYLWKISAAEATGTWSICNLETKQYLSAYKDTAGLIRDTSLSLSTYAFGWNFDNAFYITSESTGLLGKATTKNHYISVSGGTVSLTTDKMNKTAKLYRAVTALSHDFEYVDTVAPTCTTDGYEVYRCKRCGDEYQDVINALGHKDINSDNICDSCGNVIVPIQVSAAVTQTQETHRVLLLFKRTVTTYTVNITADSKVTAEVEYSTNGGLTWKKGTHFVTNVNPQNFLIRVSESNGQVTRWQYNKDTGMVSAYAK